MRSVLEVFYTFFNCHEISEKNYISVNNLHYVMESRAFINYFENKRGVSKRSFNFNF